MYSILWHSLKQVSIHAPREGCDGKRCRALAKAVRFNSRTPGGVRLSPPCGVSIGKSVSIHAPREGCD